MQTTLPAARSISARFGYRVTLRECPDRRCQVRDHPSYRSSASSACVGDRSLRCSACHRPTVPMTAFSPRSFRGFSMDQAQTANAQVVVQRLERRWASTCTITCVALSSIEEPHKRNISPTVVRSGAPLRTPTDLL